MLDRSRCASSDASVPVCERGVIGERPRSIRGCLRRQGDVSAADRGKEHRAREGQNRCKTGAINLSGSCRYYTFE